MLSKKNGKRLSNITKEYMINIKSLLINIYSIPSFQKNNNIVCVWSNSDAKQDPITSHWSSGN